MTSFSPCTLTHVHTPCTPVHLPHVCAHPLMCTCGHIHSHTCDSQLSVPHASTQTSAHETVFLTLRDRCRPGPDSCLACCLRHSPCDVQEASVPWTREWAQLWPQPPMSDGVGKQGTGHRGWQHLQSMHKGQWLPARALPALQYPLCLPRVSAYLSSLLPLVLSLPHRGLHGSTGAQEHMWGLCLPPLLRKGDSLACGRNVKSVQVHTDVLQQDKWVPSRAQQVQRGEGCSGHTAAHSQIPH